MDFSFKKEERLYKKAELEELFKSGKKIHESPFNVIHKSISLTEVIGASTPIKVAISIPKKRFKKAVDRNHLKRLCREAYRLNRNDLKASLKDSNQSIHFMLIYNSNDPLPFKLIEDKIILILRRLHRIYAENNR